MQLSKLDKHCAVKLKLLRKQHKLNQELMFERLDLYSQQEYSKLENEKSHFTDEIILKICTVFNISILEFINVEMETSNLSSFLSNEDYDVIENSTDSEMKLLLYKKLLLESKIENTELKLKLLYKNYEGKNLIPSKHKLHVII